MADHSQQPQPLLASGWQSGCGQMVMIFGIGLTTLSGLCTMGMTVADLSGIQYIVGAPFVLIGALIWWGGWALSRKAPGAAVPADDPPNNDHPGDPP